MLLVTVLAAFGLSAYREVRDALVQAAETRLSAAAQDLARLLTQAPEGQMATLGALAAREEVQSYLAAPTREAEAAVRAILDSLVRAAPNRAGVSIFAGTGAVVASGEEVDRPEPEESGLSPLERRGTLVAYEVVLPIAAEGGRGALVQLLTVGGNPESGQVIRSLIGEDATFLVGNADGSVWTDLVRPVDDAPPVGAGTGALTRRATEAGGFLGLVEPVEDAPWVVWVALTTDVVFEPLTSFTTRMAGTVLLLVMAGGAGAWMIGRRVTRPLVRLTAATQAMDAGDYSVRVRSDRDDEIGRLANAFDQMAAHIEEARHRLEERVAERTAELEGALGELEAAQEELVRKERLALLGELAGGVGHELRNPLGVMTNAVFYLDAVLRERPAEVGEYLGILRNQIHISEKIVTDLLDFARVKPPQRRSVDMATLVRAQLKRAGLGTAPAGVDIVVEAPDEPVQARVDEDQIAQVVLNLLTNARQAMEDGGGALTVSVIDGDDGVRVEVRDEGPGIPPEEIDKIFEPLFTTKPKGIGLGLSVSRSLAEANGGTLSVESEAGRGATFTLTLPDATAAFAQERSS
jgi:signal transduction histidine kinase